MLLNRARLARLLAELVGPEVLDLEEVAQGWPSLATIETPDGPIPVHIYLSSVGRSQRNRDESERRLQVRGGSPIQAPGVQGPQPRRRTLGTNRGVRAA